MSGPVPGQPRRQLALAQYRRFLGQEIGSSRWIDISQDRINAFAAATDDWSDIHVDSERAEAVFGGTVAHGFLTLSMISAMAIDALPEIEGRRMSVNYGFEKVRFVAPVPSGSLIRGRFVLTEVIDHRPSHVIMRSTVTVEIKGCEKAAVVADWLWHTRFD